MKEHPPFTDGDRAVDRPEDCRAPIPSPEPIHPTDDRRGPGAGGGLFVHDSCWTAPVLCGEVPRVGVPQLRRVAAQDRDRAHRRGAVPAIGTHGAAEFWSAAHEHHQDHCRYRAGSLGTGAAKVGPDAVILNVRPCMPMASSGCGPRPAWKYSPRPPSRSRLRKMFSSF